LGATLGGLRDPAEQSAQFVPERRVTAMPESGHVLERAHLRSVDGSPADDLVPIAPQGESRFAPNANGGYRAIAFSPGSDVVT